MCKRTIQRGQNLNIGLVQQRKGIIVDVDVRKMGNEIVPNEKTHQHPVVHYALDVERKWQRSLNNADSYDDGINRLTSEMTCSTTPEVDEIPRKGILWEGRDAVDGKLFLMDSFCKAHAYFATKYW